MVCKQHCDEVTGLKQRQIRIVTVLFKLSCRSARMLRYKGENIILALLFSPLHIHPSFPAPRCCSHSTQRNNWAGTWVTHKPRFTLWVKESMSIKYERESLLSIHFQLLFISWPLTAIHILIHTHLLLFTGVTKKLLLLTQQHVEDNVCACIVNRALYDGIINSFKDLQWLNRCTREMCLQIGEGSEC